MTDPTKDALPFDREMIDKLAAWASHEIEDGNDTGSNLRALLAAYDAAVAERIEEARRKMRVVDACDQVPDLLMIEAGDAHELARRLGEDRTKDYAAAKTIADSLRGTLKAARAGGPAPSETAFRELRSARERADALAAEVERLRTTAKFLDRVTDPTTKATDRGCARLSDILRRAARGLDLAGAASEADWLDGFADDARRLEVSAKSAEAERDRLRAVVAALKRATCWCDMSIGSPMMREHSRGCLLAQSAIRGEEAKP